jgi:tol-pal system protein YbgF
MNVVSNSPRPLAWMQTAALVAAVCVCASGLFAANSALAQSRLSLAERVAKLEASAGANNSQATQLELLQRLNDLQTEVQQLRAASEQQSFELEQLKKRARDQYLDLDSRLQSMAGRAPSTGQTPPSSMGDSPVSEPMTDSGAFSTANSASGSRPIPASTLPKPAVGNERADYDLAFDALKRGQYAEASKKFEGFLSVYPHGEFADNATYWLGESYYVTQKYPLALKTFQGLLAGFPQSKKAPDALLKVGYCYYQIGDTAKAATTLKSVMERYPDQPVAKLAEGRLRALQLK